MRIFDWIVIFILASAAGMGVGTGGLLVILLTLNGRTEQLTAQGLNLAFYIISGVSSLIFHLRNRRIYPDVIIPAICFGIAGAAVGTALAELLGGMLLRKIFGVILALAGGWSVIKLLKTAVSRKNL